jgi:hypothetical protein
MQIGLRFTIVNDVIMTSHGESMSYKRWIIIIPLLILLIIISALARPVSAGPQNQVTYQTPTARPDGRVIYIVQPGDTCLRIQLLTNNGTTIEELRTLNKLDEGCTLREGQEILLDVITPVPSPTQNPAITATPPLPTPTPFKGTGNICVLLYNDVNGDAVREDTELPLSGGAVSISNRTGTVSETGITTDSTDPLCKEVPEGDYTISMAIPGGYNATTVMNQPMPLKAGNQAILEFGAQVSTQQVAAPAEVETNRQPLLAIFGGLLILFGIGLGIYIAVTRR